MDKLELEESNGERVFSRSLSSPLLLSSPFATITLCQYLNKFSKLEKLPLMRNFDLFAPTIQSFPLKGGGGGGGQETRK